MRRARFVAVMSPFLVHLFAIDALASYAFYVGSALTTDGSVIVGGTGEEVSSHWLRIEPRRTHPPGAMREVGITEAAELPGRRLAIPEVEVTYRYISMEYSDFRGFPPPLTNGGLNEHGVAVRDVWAPSRRELVEMTPIPQVGLSYSDLSRLVLERARTAREAVRMVGELIARHGYATYGGNTHLFADNREGWIVWELAGGQGLWAAERLSKDEIRVLYPGYIGEIPLSYRGHPDFDGSENLITFAVQRGWYAPAAQKPFDVHKVYGRGASDMRRPGLKLVDPATLEAELRRHAGAIDIALIMRFVRDPRIADDEAGYGQVARLSSVAHSELRVLWVAPTGSVTAPFVPWFIGTRSTLPEFRAHRYLTKGSATRFVSPEFQRQEGTLFAGRLFKRLLYLTCAHPDRFLPEVTEALEAFERASREDLPEIVKTAQLLFAAREGALARSVLTRFSQERARSSLALGEALLGSIEARSRLSSPSATPLGPFMLPRARPPRTAS